MDEQLYTPQEVADILKLKKTTVYEMIKKNKLTAVKMGKQFRIPDSSLQNFLQANHNVEIFQDNQPIKIEKVITSSCDNIQNESSFKKYIVCGQDIVLDMICSAINARLGMSQFLRSYSGSFEGILSLYNEEVQIASMHLWDMHTDTYNVPFIKAMIPGEQVNLYHVLKRPVCIYTALGNPKNILSIKDFAREDVSIVNRERGSGMRVLIDSLLTQNSITSSQVKGYNRIVNSHLAAASIISRGGADCSIGTETAAFQFKNVEKLFLKNEGYDIAIRKSDENFPEIKLFIEILRSEQFKSEVSAMNGYDTTDMGKQIL